MRNGGIPVETYLRNGGAKLHHAAIYEVPSNKHYNDPRSGHELDLRLRSLVERYYNSDGKTTIKPTVIISTTSTPVRIVPPKQNNHIVKTPSSVLSHLLNVELREFHEQPVTGTKIEPKHIPDPEHTRTRVQRRKKPVPKMPSKSYPLGLQFLNKSVKHDQPIIPRILINKRKLPIVKIRDKTTIPTSTTSTTSVTTASSTTTQPTTTTFTTTTTSTPTTTTTTATTTTPSIVVTYPKEEITTSSGSLDADLGMNDPLFSISVDSLFSDPDMAGMSQMASGSSFDHHLHNAASDSTGQEKLPKNKHTHGAAMHDNHVMHEPKHQAENGHAGMMDHAHGHGHSSSHINTNAFQHHPQSMLDKTNDLTANSLDKFFVGMFKHHVPEDHGLKHLHRQEEVIPVNKDLSLVVNTPSPSERQKFEKTTMHAKPITKRGIHSLGLVSKKPRTYIDKALNVKVWETTPPTYGPRSMRYFVTTAPTVETQINRQKMTEYLSAKMRTSSSNTQGSTEGPKSVSNVQKQAEVFGNSAIQSPSVSNVSQKDLVHLKGIHIMFSNGKQDTSGTIPTIHLTASVSERKTKNASQAFETDISTKSPEPVTTEQTKSTPPEDSVVDKIVGTAVIRNGHLYLILYPFGEKKSLKLNFNGARVSKVPLPHNKPVSYTEAPANIPETTKAMGPMPKPQALVDTPPMANNVAKDTIASEYQAPESDVSVVQKQPQSTHGTMDHSSHGHGHMHHHMMSASPSGKTTFNNTTIRNFLAPISKFMSPWRSLNFSNVFPFPKQNGTSKSNGEEDNDLDVVTFIAQATDPFERIKSIMESIANTTLFQNNTSDAASDVNDTQAQAEAKFNFELKIQTSTIDQARDYKQQTTQQNNENNSEEMLYDTSTSFDKKKSSPQDLQPIHTEQSSLFNELTNSQSIGMINEYLKQMSTAETALETVTAEFKLNTMNKIKTETSTPAPEKEKTTERQAKEQTTEGMMFEEKDKTPTQIVPDISSPPFILKATTTAQSIPMKTLPPEPSTLEDFIRYQVFNESQSTSELKATDIPPLNYSDKLAAFSNPGSRVVPGKLSTGSNIQRVANNAQHGLTRGQAEQVMSLSDILNDIRRIQLHNMHKFNIQNNNFNNLMVNEASRQNKLRTPMVVEGPLFQETSTRRFSNRQASGPQRPVTAASIQSQLLEQRQNAINDALDAMLVLSVDDILADHTTLHGAIVMSQRQREQSSSNR